VNLIGNALKFTQKGNVTVRVQMRESEKEFLTSQRDALTLLFEIEDTGPGIAPEENKFLFEPFAQTETGRQEQEGTGLGLAICRKFVQLMGGDIVAASELEKGTVFAFDVRVQSLSDNHFKSQPDTLRPVSIEPGQPKYKLLLVDDNPDNRKLIFKLLAPFEFDLRGAANGREAVEIRQNWGPDLIWMDMRMPVMDGYEAVKTIRALEKEDSKMTRTTIIAQTASSFEEERSAILDAGCDDFLRKPYKDSEIF